VRYTQVRNPDSPLPATGTMKLVICVQHPFSLWNVPDWFVDRVREEFPLLDVVHLHSYKELDAAIVDADALVTWSLRAENLHAAKKLRWIHSPAAAVHAVLIPEVVASDITITNARNVHGPVVAEHAMALMYALAKRLHIARDAQRRREWFQQKMWDSTPRPRELAGATVVLVGLGAIGENIARAAHAVGMHVIGVREHPTRGSRWVERVVGFDRLDTVLPNADFVVLAAPVTDKTRRLFDGFRLALMKPSAYLVNVARGSLIDHEALASAIREKHLAGAALDVFDEEPLAADSPLWEIEELLITPHTAALSENLWQRHFDLLAENLKRFRAHRPLVGEVDKQKRY
jgi:phosphoglycerate dehydrogenase-like enzyme